MHNIAEPYQIYWVSANIQYLIVQCMLQTFTIIDFSFYCLILN